MIPAVWTCYPNDRREKGMLMSATLATKLKLREKEFGAKDFSTLLREVIERLNLPRNSRDSEVKVFRFAYGDKESADAAYAALVESERKLEDPTVKGFCIERLSRED